MTFDPIRRLVYGSGRNTRARPLRADTVLVIGLGRSGSSLATTLLELGTDVLAVDIDEEAVREWAPVIGNVRVADATSRKVLEQLDATSFDAAVVAIGSGIEASILATSALAEVGVQSIWAKAIRDDHARILGRVGAHHVVSPEREMGERIAHTVSGHVIDYFELDDDYVIAEIRAPRWVVGRQLSELDLQNGHGITVVCVRAEGGGFAPASAETVIGAPDILVVAGNEQYVERFAAVR